MRQIAFLLAILAAVTGRAEAQPAPWQPDRLTAGWTFTPGAAFGALWDSNVTVRNQGDPQLREWVALINPRGELDFNGRRTRLNAGYSGALEAYRRFSELNRYEQRARLSVRYQATQRLHLETRTTYTASPTTDRLELGTLPFVDIGSKVFDTGGGIRLQTSPRTRVELDYRFQQVTFDRESDPLQPTFLDGGYAHSPAARVVHELTDRVSITGEYQYQYARLAEGRDRFDVQNAIGEASVRLGPATTLRAGAGAAHVSVPSTGLTAWGPAFRAAVEHRVDRTTVTARYVRMFVPTFSFGGLTGNQELSGEVRVPLTTGGRLSAIGSTTYSRTEPVEQLGLGFRVDSFWLTGGLGYQAAPWLRTEGFVSTMHQTSTARGNIDRLRVGVQFVTSKPVRIE